MPGTVSTPGVVVGASEPLFRDALARVVRQSTSMRLRGEASTGGELLAMLRGHAPAVAVVEADALGLGGIRLLRLLETTDDPARLLFVGIWLRSEEPYELLAAGAAGCLTRSAQPDEVVRAISSVVAGGTYLAADVQTALATEIKLRARDPNPRLTRREHEILERVAAGESAPSIGRAMHLSAATVKTHLGHLYQKLGVSERAAAVAVAMRRGLLE
jgi:two-component system nitrate/nitrite response regulator NarL